MMKKWFLPVLAVLLYFNLNAQQNIADSLVALANKKSGIEKADLLNDAAEKFLDSNPDKSIELASQALEISDKNHDAKNAYYAMLFISNAYANKGDHDKALEVLIDAAKKYEADLAPVYAAQLNTHLGMAYGTSELFEKALQHQLQALDLLSPIDKNGNQDGVKMLKMNIQKSIGDLFSRLENYPKALTHYDEALELSRERGDSMNMAFIYNSVGIAYEQQKKYSEAIENYFNAMNILERLGYTSAIGNIKVNIALLYYFKEEYPKALKYALEALEILEQSPNRYPYATSLSTVGRIYLKMNEADQAYKYINKSYQMANENGYTDLLTDSYHFLGQYYALKNDYKQAYEYNRRYVQHKDSLYNIELSSRIHELQTRYETGKKEQEIELLTKDTEIKDLRLRRQKALLFSLLGVVVLLAVVGVLWYRSIRQKQRLEKSEMEKRNLRAEQKLLRAQINPHFMFNALNSVQCYISANDTLKAMTYLAKFSQLMRNILEHSRKSMIALEEEITTLKLYMELESMRFSHSFEYEINVGDDIVASRSFIPPMLVQPFVENSIKHGFTNKIEKGKIHIEFLKHDGMMTCLVEDNGIGREKAKTLKSSGSKLHKSLGMQVTKERLLAMKKDRNIDVNFSIEDLKSTDGTPCGTRVVMDVPCETE